MSRKLSPRASWPEALGVLAAILVGMATWALVFWAAYTQVAKEIGLPRLSYLGSASALVLLFSIGYAVRRGPDTDE